jgi:ATP-dependent exoDNAse (exonuclease V) beta subunit
MSVPPSYLAELNPHEKDKYIEFEEFGHKYTVKGVTGYTSITTLIGKMFEHFDANKIIDKMFKNEKKMLDPRNKYFGMSRESIIEMWAANGKEASEKGTFMHANIENYYNNIDSDDGSIEFKFFKSFVADFPNLKPYRTEWCVYYEAYKICGSIDMIFENEDGTLQIYDWKRVKNIEYEAFGNKSSILPGLSHIPDSNVHHYSIQLNLYKMILEKQYGKKVTNLFLVIMHPDQKNYERIEIPILSDEVDIILNSIIVV